MALREKYHMYGMPRRAPIWLRAAIVIVGGAIVLTFLWLAMPHTPVGVAIDAVLTLLLVFGGVFWALSGRDAETSRPGPVDAGGGREREADATIQPPSTQSH
jgi:hypothetical protein